MKKDRPRKSLIICESIIAIFAIAVMGFISLFSGRWKEQGETPFATSKIEQTEWEKINSDGTREKVKLPLVYKKMSVDEPLILESIVPEGVTDKDYFATYLHKQAAKIYIDGELRYEYMQTSEYFYWNEIVCRYVFFPVSSADIGKTIRIEMMTPYNTERGIGEVYYGEKMSVELGYWTKYLSSFLFSFIFVLVGVTAMVIGITLRFVTKGKVRVDYIGTGVLLIAAWNGYSSDITEFITSNVIAAKLVPMLIMMIIPMILAFYFDSIQGRRYHKAYVGVFIIAVINFVISVILQLNRIRNVNENKPITYFMVTIILGVFIAGTYIDRKKKQGINYALIMHGFLILFAFSIAQLILRNGYKNNENTLFCLGVMVFTICAIIHAVKYVNMLEVEKRQALTTADAKSQFLATMSHEIRTPINAVLGMNEAILRECADENICGYAKDIDGAGRLLLSIINDILDYTKLESGKMELASKEYSLKSVVKNCCNLIEGKAADKGLKYVLDVDKELPDRLIGDEIRIEQVITNILSNAVKYTKHGSVKLSVSGERLEGDRINIIIAVADTGMGIKEEDIDKLFDTFIRLDENKNANIEGTGLGLSIVKKLVDAMGGTIKVESNYGSGSVFTINVPQQFVGDDAIGDVTLDSLENNSGTIVFNNIKMPDKRILVVDDVEMNLKVFKTLLKDTEIKIDTAISGKQCIAMTKRVKYDMIFLDHMMPEMDGIETLHAIHAMPDSINADTPTIMLTANAISGAKELYMQEGFIDYITKPFTGEAIQNTLIKYIK